MNFKKYRLTDDGERLFPRYSGIYSLSVCQISNLNIDVETGLEFCILEEVPDKQERITLYRSLQKGNREAVFKNVGNKYIGEQVKNMEHALNNEWHLIPECMELMEKLAVGYVNALHKHTSRSFELFIAQEHPELSTD